MSYEEINVCISILAFIIATFLSVITILNQKEKKKLTFERLQILSPININGELKKELAVKYPGLVSSLFLLIANIRNTGDLSIRDHDIITPIKISFPEKIIDCVVIEENPKRIDVRLTKNYEENSVECNFELLNVRDYFTLRFVSLEKLSLPTIVSRIDSLPRINTSNFDANYSSENLVKRSFRKTLHVLRDTEFYMPIVAFTIPGLIILIGDLFLGAHFLQEFLLGHSLTFGSTIFMGMTLIGGAFMVLLGLLMRLVVSNYKSYSKFNKYFIAIKVLGIISLITSLFLAYHFLIDFMSGRGLEFGPTMLMVLLFVGGLFMILIGLVMHLVVSNQES